MVQWFHMKQFTSKTQKIGKYGEDICEAFLKKDGYKLIERNYTTKQGEIDIISKKEKTLHFIEVKSISQRNVSYETYNPAENLTKTKFEKIKKTVRKYLELNKVSYETFQIDLYMVYIDSANKKHKIQRIENITDF